MFFVNYLPESLYQPLKLSNVRPTDFANSKHAQELKVEDRLGFREMFRMDVGDFEFILGKVLYLISPRQMSNFGSHLPIIPDERLALTLRYIATGE